MADLPEERATHDDPTFTNVGMDFFGTLELKQGRAIIKWYGAIRAVCSQSHNTNSRINAIRRCVARRGTVKVMRSDNGTYLVGLTHTNVQNKLLTKEINLIFNPLSG